MINLINNSILIKTIRSKRMFLFIGLVLALSIIGIYFAYNQSESFIVRSISEKEAIVIDDETRNTSSTQAIMSDDDTYVPYYEPKAKVTVASNQNIVENYLNYDLTKSSNLSADEIDMFLSDTNLEGLGAAFLEAEVKYNVNAKYLMAHAIHESDWGRSKIASDKYNLFGFRAYDGDSYGSAKTYSSYDESIDLTAKFISKNYLSDDGKYYNGPTLKGMNVYYATSDQWSYKIANIMKDFDNKILKG